MIQTHFPGWGVFVYIGNDVPGDFIEKLQQIPNVYLRYTNAIGEVNMVHRFYAIDEPGVALMMVRDADSRIHWKDRWAIHNFLPRTDFIAHLIRDHEQHYIPLLGGLWGLRKVTGFPTIQSLFHSFDPTTYTKQYKGLDQKFLAAKVYPLIQERLFVHYSHTLIKRNEQGLAFPFQWSPSLFCGRGEVVNTEQRDVPPPQMRWTLPHVPMRLFS
jgi:hypothetical protein